MANLTQITGKIRLQLGKERSFRGHLVITRSWRRGTRPMDGRWRRKHQSSGVEGRKDAEAVPNRGRAIAEYSALPPPTREKGKEAFSYVSISNNLVKFTCQILSYSKLLICLANEKRMCLQ